jgi:hypothetical protein
MTALTPSPPDRGGHDNMSGERTYRWIPDLAQHNALVDKLQCGAPEPRPALEIVRADLAGTLKGLVAIVLVFALIVGCAAAIGG